MNSFYMYLVYRYSTQPFTTAVNRYAMMIGLIALLALIIIFVYIHKRGKPLQSMAYKDGRMAYVWFEARAKLSQVQGFPLFELSRSDELSSLPVLVELSMFPTYRRLNQNWQN